MTGPYAHSTAHLTLLVLLIVSPKLAGAAPVRDEEGKGGLEGHTWTYHKEDSLASFLSPPAHSLSSPDNGSSDQQGQRLGSDDPADPSRVLAVLLESLDHTEDSLAPASRDRDGEGDQRQELPPAESTEGGEIRAEKTEEERGVEGSKPGRRTDKAIERLILGRLTAAQGADSEREDELQDETSRSDEARTWSLSDAISDGEGVAARTGEWDLGSLSEETRSGSTLEEDDFSLQRQIRGYFQNIDLGLQDNEILPPLKGYKAYNTQLARAGKKQHWQESQSRNGAGKGGNFMDEFENEGEELEEEVTEEEETLSHMEEEARARAEKQEVLRQQEEAEQAREEEQRLADIASDMLLQYMGKKQQSYMKPRQKSSNTAEDKRSEEILADEDDLDQQMIDRLIEISSKLHLPADDVVEIISDVEEKKKKRKELLQQPLHNKNSPIAPRFRPLVPPPLAGPPIYHYTASKNPKKAPYKHNKSNKKWHKDKVKSYKKQDYWYKPPKQLDYWYKPQKQFLAFPSYPYYQKPYRAYYPVYFPHPKPQYFGKPSSSKGQLFGRQELDLEPPRRRHRGGGGKNRGQQWRQQPLPHLPVPPYISNYILPHPRTYRPLPPPKPIMTPRRGRQPPFYHPQVTPADDYEEDGLVPQLDSEEELENFIERIYMKRRMY